MSVFHLNGAELLPDPSGALYWPAERTLVAADLHLEKGSAFAAGGSLLPPYDSAATLRQLEQAMTHHRPRRVLCLGDSFHDGGAPARLGERDRDAVRALTARAEWTWIAGNHDPAPPRHLGGRVESEIVVGPLLFRHAARKGAAAGEVSGHYHPKATVSTRGRSVTGRCFVEDGARLVLPAFGAYAGGLDIFDPAIRALFPRGFAAHVLGQRRVHRFVWKMAG